MKQVLVIAFLLVPFFLSAQVKKIEKKIIFTGLANMSFRLSPGQDLSRPYLSIAVDWQNKSNFSFGFHFNSDFTRFTERNPTRADSKRKSFSARIAFGPSLNWHQPISRDGQWEFVWLSRISTRLGSNRRATNSFFPFVVLWDDIKLATHPGLIYHINDRLSAVGLLGEISFTHLGPLARNGQGRSNDLAIDFGLDQIRLGIRLNLLRGKHHQKS